ncbi:YcaO-like family protein [Sediminivirga luteola]|uniref:YcaO domain-containing protein n=1 Tax=Sediminivirga luteola TaxID=1774748 RepID=A0A8J2U051_9MICO|nr:YcaO-like family protein [Sediminivirga luteola]GGA23577.1 hypothetical protein GCM10011333_28260 [Sediminivirga luteola]
MSERDTIQPFAEVYPANDSCVLAGSGRLVRLGLSAEALLGPPEAGRDAARLLGPDDAWPALRAAMEWARHRDVPVYGGVEAAQDAGPPGTLVIVQLGRAFLLRGATTALLARLRSRLVAGAAPESAALWLRTPFHLPLDPVPEPTVPAPVASPGGSARLEESPAAPFRGPAGEGVPLEPDAAQAAGVWRWQDGGWRPVPVLPLPDEQVRHDTSPGQPEDLLDPDAGVVLAVTELGYLPVPLDHWRHRQWALSALERVDPEWRPDALVPDVSPDRGSRPGLIRAGAFYASEYLRQIPLRRARWDELADAALDPEQTSLFDPALTREPGCPLIPWQRTTEVLWTPGRDLAAGTPLWVPLSLACMDWTAPSLRPAPLTNPSNFFGMGAGDTEAAALEEGLSMVLAAHAAQLWWRCGAGLVPVDLACLPERAAQEGRGRRRPDAGTPGGPGAGGTVPGTGSSAGGELEVTAWRILTPWSWPCVLVRLHDAGRDMTVVGHGAGPSMAQAVERALSTAGLQYVSAREIADPAGSLCGSSAGLRPYREDRRWREDYRADGRDLLEPMMQLQRALDPHVQALLRGRLAAAEAAGRRTGTGPDGAGSAGHAVTGAQGAPAWREAAQQAAAAGFQVIGVDMTTADLAAAGVRAWRVVLPGAYVTAPEALPPDPSLLGRHAETLGLPPPDHTEPYPGW